ncbi:MAG: discoidin domain-containing protein [Phycisphaerales bacterium]|nr:MAG: discoidin domain-containing protein [Phycisphaerales bacterium]
MVRRMTTCIVITLMAVAVPAEPLQVDLSQSGDVQVGWIDWNTGGDRLGNSNVSRQFLNEADFDSDFTIDFIKIDSRNRAQVDESVPLHDVLDDALKEGDPFDMVIHDLAAGIYRITTYHHDPLENVENDDGTLNITVTDADGTRLVADHFQQTWGPNPGIGASVTFTFRSDGTGDIVLTFADNNDGIHNEAFLNGFELDIEAPPERASSPEPADGATDVPRTVVVSWLPGEDVPAVDGHRVYFCTSFVDVNDGTAAALRGLTSEPEFDPGDLAEGIAFGTTHYWRVDEADGVGGWHVGDVWSFTTEPFAYPVETIQATASSATADAGPENTINGSGLDDSDLHSMDNRAMWLSDPTGAQPTWIQYEFDRIHKLHEMWVWNYNVTFEPVLGFGLKDVTVEYSQDGTDWAALGEVQLAQGSSQPGYARNTAVDLAGVAARYVRLRVNSGWGALPQYGLSEVRFFYIPVQAREPRPASGATDVGPNVTLSWRAGRKAAAHDVRLGADRKAVVRGTAPATTVAETAVEASDLALGQTYYWQVNEVNAAATPAVWVGEIWTFTTPSFLVVEDFEDYDDAENLIFDTWIDGWVNETGSTVGYLQAPFAEKTIVYSGNQAMPLAYDNTGAPFSSEAECVFDTPQDWTTHGIAALVLYFQGDSASTPGAGAELSLTLEDASGHAATVGYDGPAQSLTEAWWHEWNVDLSALSADGVDLTRVAKIVLRVGSPTSGGSGLLYIDALRLLPRRCVASLASPGADLNGDCRVDYLDLQIMADNWLAEDRTLSTTPEAPATTGLLAQYPLDGDTQNSAGPNLHGAVNGNPVYVDGIAGSALRLGGNAFVDCTNNVALDAIGEAITVAAWIKVDVFDKNYQTIVAKGDSSWRLSRNQTTDNIHWRCNGPSPDLRVNGQANVNDGQWHHVAGTYDGAVARLYVDGIEDGSVATSGPIATNTERVYLGENAEAPGRQWNGLIDDVRIYSRALSADEIRYLADRTPGDGALYVPIASPAELYDGEPENARAIDLKDFAALAGQWRDEQAWP